MRLTRHQRVTVEVTRTRQREGTVERVRLDGQVLVWLDDGDAGWYPEGRVTPVRQQSLEVAP